MFGTQGATGISHGHAPASSSPVSALVYRSRAVTSLSSPDLLELAQAAQARNRHEAITGVMLYDDQTFFQWLEGPRDSVDRVMHSIYRDRRHTGVEVLSQRSVPTRTFPGWDMRLVGAGANLGSLPDYVVEAPHDLMEDLRRRPQAAPGLLAKLDPLNRDDPAASDQFATLPYPHRTTAILRDAMVSAVIPQLARQHRSPAETPTPRHSVSHPRAKDLADLLVDADSSAVWIGME